MAALGEFIRSQRASERLSLRDLAERAEVSNAYLSQVERGLHEPSVRVLQAIAAGLGVQLDLLLRHAGLLEGDTASETEAAIMADAWLTGPQKFALLSVYRGFMAGNA